MVNSKTCTKCNNEIDIYYFCKQSKSPDGYTYWCYECRKEYRIKYENIEENRLNRNAKNSERNKSFQNKFKANIPCKDCGKVFEPYCMDFDHIPERGKKYKNVSRMMLEDYPEDLILEEIKKCDLVCILCHNKRTHEINKEKYGNDIEKYYATKILNIKTIRKFKEKPCAICGNQYEHYNMQADHIDPSTKLYAICSLKNHKHQMLLDELEKCQVLCALCHRRKSILEQKEGKYLTTKISHPPELERKKLFYDPETNMKECGICHQIKHISVFRKREDSISGADTYCIECFNEYRRKRRAQNKIQSDINK
jgi:hypothetical protein